jgi:FKBP-type peptidyl-prolyl cis-trans isomerase SlyD
MSFDGAKVRQFLIQTKLFRELCAQTALFLTQIKNISIFISNFAAEYIIIYNMEKKNRFITANYQLYSVVDGKKELEEQTSEEHPFQFITGFGISLDAFEQNIIGLENGSDFDFSLQPSDAFGEYIPEGVHKLAKETFTVNGHFDNENIYEGAVITLMDNEEHRFMAKVVKIEDDGVTVDTNHPLAGKILNFKGKVIENRDATDEEIKHLIKHLTGGCNGCGHHHGEGCESCGDGCGHNEEGCGCGHCH